MVIGGTGGMGCGKSTVSEFLAEKLDAPILDADKISHEAFSSPHPPYQRRPFTADFHLTSSSSKLGYVEILRPN